MFIYVMWSEEEAIIANWEEEELGLIRGLLTDPRHSETTVVVAALKRAIASYA